MNNPEQPYSVCLGRQLGSGGRIIGRQIADELGLQFYDKELIFAAAAKSGYSKELFEENDEEKSNFHTFLTNFIPFLGSTDFYGNQVDEESLFSILSQTIKELAQKESCLFVGRCAEYILREQTRMTSIFISANAKDRIKRVAEHRKISNEAARRAIADNDKRRAAFHDFYSNYQWGYASTYELCINSSLLGLEGTKDFCVDFIRRRFNLTGQ